MVVEAEIYICELLDMVMIVVMMVFIDEYIIFMIVIIFNVNEYFQIDVISINEIIIYFIGI